MGFNKKLRVMYHVRYNSATIPILCGAGINDFMCYTWYKFIRQNIICEMHNHKQTIRSIDTENYFIFFDKSEIVVVPLMLGKMSSPDS